MKSLNESVNEYKKMLAAGDVQRAYRGIVHYMAKLRIHFESAYPQYTVSGAIYQGFMDMTYFAIAPDAFKKAKLKIGIVLMYQPLRFEVWLFGINRPVQAKYLAHFQGRKQAKPHWKKENADSIIEAVLVEQPDFDRLEALTRQIESGTIHFLREMQEELELS
ncbi:MAG: hypothetical protein KDD94_04385 [Calditrichaeota bacterium]|nr:hypothetical protein [Calditrichota bacterium]